MNKPWPLTQQSTNVMAAHHHQSIVFLGTAHDNGGTSFLASNLAAAMRKEGHRVEEWYLFDSPAKLPPGARLFIKSPRSRSPLTLLILFVRVTLALRRTRPDALIALQPLSNVLVGVAGRIAGIRNRIASLHGPFREDNPVLVRTSVFFGRHGFYRHIIACAQSVADTFITNGPDYMRRLVVISNGHTQPALVPKAEARRALGLPAQGVVLGQIGRLCFQKYQTFSINLIKKLPHASLLLIGIGPDDAALKSEINAAGLSDRVRIIPSIEHARIGHFYSAVDLVLFPSRFEGLSLAAIEALQAGVPLLCSDIPSFREMFATSQFLADTLIAPLDEPECWCTRAAALLSDRDLSQCVKTELRRLSSTFSFDRMAQQYLALLD